MPLFFMKKALRHSGCEALGQNSHQTGVKAAQENCFLTDYVSSTQGIALLSFSTPLLQREFLFCWYESCSFGPPNQSTYNIRLSMPKSSCEFLSIIGQPLQVHCWKIERSLSFNLKASNHLSNAS